MRNVQLQKTTSLYSYIVNRDIKTTNCNCCKFRNFVWHYYNWIL